MMRHFVTAAVLLLVARDAAAVIQPPTVRLACAVAPEGVVLNVTVANDADDMAFLMGSVWRGHYNEYSLSVIAESSDPDRPSAPQFETFSWSPPGHPAIVEGPVFPWIVPLHHRASYSIAVLASDFLDAYRRQPIRLTEVTSPVKVRAVLDSAWARAGGRDSLDGVWVWFGESTSNTTSIPGDCTR